MPPLCQNRNYLQHTRLQLPAKMRQMPRQLGSQSYAAVARCAPPIPRLCRPRLCESASPCLSHSHQRSRTVHTVRDRDADTRMERALYHHRARHHAGRLCILHHRARASRPQPLPLQRAVRASRHHRARQFWSLMASAENRKLWDNTVEEGRSKEGWRANRAPPRQTPTPHQRPARPHRL